ncbi:MAG: AraC family transcriptional regulator ligand-binding domain-containing protein [Xanthobacteraceae bacterium]|nr:AraC family transcriptional regulator ligand-binding domain-containing protein [Xanthobacteraceae bacterium]
MQEPSVISAAVAEAILSTISSKGGDAGAILAKLCIPPSANDLGVWPLAKFTALLEAAAAEKRDVLFGLTLGKSFQLQGLGPITTLMLSSVTGADAFTKFTEYFPAFQNNTKYGFSISDHTARLSYSITDPTVKLRRQDAHFTIALERSILTEFLGSEIQPTRIDFQHQPDSSADVGEYRAHFNCDVRFGCLENAIYLPAKVLNAAGRHADPHLSAKVEADLVEKIRSKEKLINFSLSIEAWMASALSAGMGIDLEDAASDFGMSLRSFQRKLSADDINFLELRNKVRVQIAKSLLGATALPITSIALYLGYSETSAFCRHFKNKTGHSPSHFRIAGPTN